jgi:hypothetical protein
MCGCIKSSGGECPLETRHHHHLPPVGVLSVDNLKEVPPLEANPRLSTWDQMVIGWIVVKVWLHVHLRKGGYDGDQWCFYKQPKTIWSQSEFLYLQQLGRQCWCNDLQQLGRQCWCNDLQQLGRQCWCNDLHFEMLEIRLKFWFKTELKGNWTQNNTSQFENGQCGIDISQKHLFQCQNLLKSVGIFGPVHSKVGIFQNWVVWDLCNWGCQDLAHWVQTSIQRLFHKVDTTLIQPVCTQWELHEGWVWIAIMPTCPLTWDCNR